MPQELLAAATTMPRTYEQHAYESTKWILGPMPVTEFIHEFLPHPGGSFPLPLPENPFVDVPFGLGRSQVHQPLVSAFQ